MRTRNNNELRLEHVNEVVTLVGWCSKKRNLGGLIFIDLRDRSGIIQLVVNPENEYYDIANNIKNEYVIKASGIIVKRDSVNPNIPTGEIEVNVSYLEILSKTNEVKLEAIRINEIQNKITQQGDIMKCDNGWTEIVKEYYLNDEWDSTGNLIKELGL